VEVLDILLVHLLLSCLELLQPSLFVFTNSLDDLAKKVVEIIDLLYRQEDLSTFAKIPKLINTLLELSHQETNIRDYISSLSYENLQSSFWSLASICVLK